MNLPKAQKRALPVALVIDDDTAFRSRLARALAARGFAVHEAPCAAQGLALALEKQPALITLDLRMPGGSGLDIVAELAALSSAPCILLLSGYGSIPVAVEAVKRGAADVLTKPVSADQIMAAYKKFLECGASAPLSGACLGARLPSKELPQRARSPQRHGQPRLPEQSGTEVPHSKTTPTLTEVEWDHIHRVMADCAGNISEAARRLGVHRRSLQRKLEKRAG